MISKEYVYVRGGCTFPWIPVIVYMPFGSSGRRCITTLSRSKRSVGLGWLVGRHNRPVGKASKAWLSDGRRRPGFRRLCTCPLDPLGVVASMRNRSRNCCWVVGPSQPTGNDSRGKASKARLSDGRWRQRQGGDDPVVAVLIRTRYHCRRAQKRPSVYVFCSIIS